MKTLKIFGLVLLFSLLVIFVPRMGFAGDTPDQGTKEKCCSWTAGKTSVSDPSPEERKMLHGLKLPDGYWERREKAEKLEVPKGVTFPIRFDWRDSSGVTRAKSQGQCGSCWDFCAVGALEAHVKIYGEVEMDLCEQQVLSCKAYGFGCNGAWPELAYELFRDVGSAKEECMPYRADHWVPCADDTCEKWAKISHWSVVCNDPPDVEAIKYAIYNHGPVATLMAAPDTFENYQGGCFDYPYFDLNHCVLLVGWDDTLCDGAGAWIGKNSWGRTWGMDGFFYIHRGVCLIGTGTDLIHYIFHRPYVRLEDYGVNDEAGGDGDGTPERGETVRLDFSLKNLWSPLGQVEVTATADTEGIVITDDYSFLGDLDSKEIKDNSTDPMEFYVPDDFPVRRVYFTFHVSGDSGGGVIYTADTTVEIWVGKVELLLVDDDQGTGKSSNVDDYYVNALDSLKEIYHVWDKVNQPDTFYNFSDYEILIWFTGDHRDSVFSDADIESLMTFLNDGGGLFLTSQDAVEVLSSGDALRQQFLTNYLHVGYDGNNDKRTVVGKSGDEVGDTLWIKPWGIPGANNQTSKDNLVPDSETDTVLGYAELNWTPTDLIAGTKFQNDYFKVVLFGFGFEAIISGYHQGHWLSNPQFVMQRVLDWLQAPGPTINVMYPNGGEIWFVDSTCSIYWESISFEDSVKIELFTDAGRESLTIVDTTTNDGEYCWVPDALALSDSCLVRISDVDNGRPCDTSNSFFFILNYVHGDANDDDVVNIADVVYLINYLFGGGDPPIPMAAGDVNRDCVVNIADVVYLINYLFGGGDPPQPGCA